MVSSENRCEQTDCIANQNNICIYYRYPVWNGFGTEECKKETNEMLKYEEVE